MRAETTSNLPSFNRITLAFDDGNYEDQYLRSSLAVNIHSFRIICMVGFGIHLLYLLLDVFGTYSILVPYRLFVSLPTFGIPILLSGWMLKNEKIKLFHFVSFSMIVMVIFINLFFSWIKPSSYISIAHTVPVIFYATYIFIGLPFRTLLYYLGPLTLMTVMGFLWFIADYPTPEKVDITIRIGINFMIATMAKYNIERFSRRNFAVNNMLSHQAKVIEDINNELFHQKELFSGLTNRADELISIRNTDGQLEFVSPGLEEVLGYSAEELLKSGTDFIIHPDDLTAMKEKRKQLHQGKQELEYRMKCKSGEYIWVHSTGIPIYNRDGEMVAIQGNTRNITKQKETELTLADAKRRLEALNEQKNKFFSIISHDLKGPIGNLKMFTQLLANNGISLPPEKMKEAIAQLDQSASNTYELLEDLLTWSKSQLEGASINKTSCKLDKLISSQISVLEQLATAKQLSISCTINKKLIVYADKEMIKTVFRNLLSNAIKFSCTGDHIQLYTVNESDDHITIVIEDQGTGIPADRINKLFRYDERESTAGTNNEKGTGLGLKLCKDFLEMNDGTIHIESTEGIGTRVFCALPLVESDHTSS